MHRNILFAVFVLFWIQLNAQEQEIYVRAKSDDHGVHIRWAPSTVEVWQWGLEAGYIVLRSDMGNEDEKWVVLDTIFPASIEEFKKYSTHTNRAMLNLGASSIYGATNHSSIDSVQESENRYSGALYAADNDALTARLLGLRFLDKNADEAERCQYLVLLNQPQDTQRIQGSVFIDRRLHGQAAPILINRVVEDENKVTLEWHTHPRYPDYTSYFVERSSDGESFERLTERPYAFTPDIDSLVPDKYVYYRDSVENYQQYYYRIQGVDLFGDLGPYSEVVVGMGRDRTPPAAATDLTYEWQSATAFTLHWSYQTEEEILGFNIRSTDHLDNPAVVENETLLDAEAHFFEGTLMDMYRGRAYFVCAVDSAGNESYSNPILVFKRNTDAPAMVQNIAGSIDSNGVLLISWSANQEEDLWGYMIDMANDSADVFSRVVGNPIADTFYRDTLSVKTLSKALFVRVVASDWAGNLSPVSPILRIDRPDLIPPSSPVFKRYKVDDGAVYLQWAPSVSPDVAAHRLWRKSAKDAAWEKIADFIPIDIGYKDTSVQYGRTYTYRIEAEDEAGNVSYCPKNILVKTPLAKNENEIEDVKVENSRDGILLSWSYSHPNVARYIVYRSVNDGPHITIRTTGEQSIRLGLKEGDEKHSYRIRAQHRDGRKSKLSEAVKL